MSSLSNRDRSKQLNQLIPLWLDKIHQGLSAIASLGKGNFIGVGWLQFSCYLWQD
ncbi:hypothetical protein H6F77_09590 [Microcoleus sp. FACHB-831]|uniref:hypothetical protein n=1 Tax=Microcoleus sp. FACHB-831 TaxID=2692827 RepID=UPI001686913C|nr:hypothetical protein [Microcoleus sp. FACHB-831]MBD1921341.1 hypothetical protein [Microcoleus sp. FACHB-831]